MVARVLQRILSIQQIKRQIGLPISSRKYCDKKNPGDERLQTDDLLLNDASLESTQGSSTSNIEEQSDPVQLQPTTIDSSSNKSNDTYNDEAKLDTTVVDRVHSPFASIMGRALADSIQLEENALTTSLIARAASSNTLDDESKEPGKNKAINDFSPTFIDPTSDRKLNLGRPDENKKKEEENDKQYSSSSGDTKNELKAEPMIMYSNESAPAKENIASTNKARITSSAPGYVTQLVSSSNSELTNRNFGFTTMESVMNAKNCIQKHGHKLEIRKIEESKIEPNIKINPLDPISPLLPGYKPFPTEKDLPLTLPTKDLIKPVKKILTYEAVPGPIVLKTIGKIWKYIPMLGTQFVATFIYAMQSVISSCDRQLKYPNIYPYYYLFSRYGPMVKLSSPLGADILILAVNGLEFPLVHTKIRGNKAQSLFDSLNAYRKDAPAVMGTVSPPNLEKSKIPGNPTLTVEKYYSSIEKITDYFIRRGGKFFRGHTGAHQYENHENDLVKWALQCTLDVYFKSKRNVLDDSSNDSKLFESFQKASKSIRLSETGIQFWRLFTTLTWLDLVEYCKYLDRYIADDASTCLTGLIQGKTNGSVLELLLSTEELNSSDILTPLLDLLLINVNLAASTTGFLLYNLAKNPQVQRNVFREISNVLPKGGGEIPQADLAKLKYLNACIIETLRMVPPFPVLSRELTEDTKMHGFQVPRGTFIQMVNVLPCARGDFVNDEIGKFQAERWSDKGSFVGGDPLVGLPQWNSFPHFNKDLVVTQIALLVAKIVREYRIDYPHTEIYSDGMVLAGPTTPFNFTFLERVI